MAPEVIGVIFFAIMLLMVLNGIPLFTAMMSTAIVGMWLVSGPKMALLQLAKAPFSLAASYSYAVLPLFTLVGMLAGETGIAKGAYDAAKAWLSKLRGGLLYTTVLANAIFGACSGIGTAGSIIFSKIALPELESNGYDRRLSLGCICGASSLAALIPPSIPIVMYCLLTNYSIGTTLMCGLGAGILQVIVTFGVIKVTSLISPQKIPPVREEDKHVPLKDKVRSLKLLIPILLLFALIIGGTFAGWFHSTVGGPIGAVAVIIYAICKRIPAKRILAGAWEGGHVFAGIYPIIIAGTIFSRFVSMSGMPAYVIRLLTSTSLPPWGIYLLVIVYFLICGCIMDIVATIIISVPVVFPLLVDTLGYNPYALVIVLVMISNIASLTPPVGMGVFTVSNATRIPSAEIFKGVTPFFFAQLIVCLIVAFVPQLIMVIPNLLS